MRQAGIPRPWFSTVLLALAISTAAAAQPTTKDPAPVDVRLRPVRWQPLPSRIMAVFVGPDQRVWYELDRTALPAGGSYRDLSATKRIIEREFFAAAPQIVDARPCLFQRGGRVWFIAGIPERLIGWDGNTWIEHDPNSLDNPSQRTPGFHVLSGNLPGHGAWSRSAANLQIGDTLLFVLNDGITTYDTKANRWEHQMMSRPGARTLDDPPAPDLMPTPDGRGAFALARGREPALWRWADGKWAKAPPPWPAAVAADRIPPQMTLVETGVWVIHNNRFMAFYTFDGRAPRGFDALARQLAADDFATRDRATRVLAGMGPTVRPWLEQARKDAGDDEVGLRLDAALRNLANSAKVALAPEADVDVVDWVRAVDRRRVILNGHDDRGPQGSGIRTFLADVDGAFVELDAARARGVGAYAAGDSISLPVARPDVAWVPRVERNHAGLVDLKTGKVLETVPSDRFNWLHAVKADGTLFVGPGEPSLIGGRPVMVYQGAAPDDRVALGEAATAVPLASEAFCVAADGSIWADRAADAGAPGGIARFDGKTWAVVPKLAGVRSATMFQAGAGGEVLVESRDGTATMLTANGLVVRARTIADLIDAEHDAVAAAFPATWRGGHSSDGRCRLFADPAGNVWLKRAGPPWTVRTADGWQDGDKAAAAALGKNYFATQLEPVGDGTRALVVDANHAGGHTFLVGVKGGRLDLTPAPHASRSTPADEFVRDRDGYVYLPGAGLKRVDPRGEIHALPGGEGSGSPRFADADGGAWTPAKAGYLVGPELTIWRDGKPAQKISVPASNTRTHFFADRPGSAYAWNAAGLHHFTVAAGKDGQYALEKTYALDDVPDYSSHRECSPLGLLATVSSSGLPRQFSLHLVRLPK